MTRCVLLMMLISGGCGFVYAEPETSAPEKPPATPAQAIATTATDPAPKEIVDEKLAQEIRRRRRERAALSQLKNARAASLLAPVSFQFVDASVTEVARVYADFAANDQVLVSTRVSELRVSVAGENVSAAEAIRRIEDTFARAGVGVVHLTSGTVAFMASPVVDAK